jgi:hypothetical protein
LPAIGPPSQVGLGSPMKPPLPRTQVGKVSKVTLRANIGAKLEHETTE